MLPFGESWLRQGSSMPRWALSATSFSMLSRRSVPINPSGCSWRYGCS